MSVELIKAKQKDLDQKLQAFDEAFRSLDLKTRIDKFRDVFEPIMALQQEKLTDLYPKYKDDPRFTDHIANSEKRIRNINKVYQSLIMIHVDEPGNEFGQKLDDITELYHQHRQADDALIAKINSN